MNKHERKCMGTLADRDALWLNEASRIAQESPDPSTKVGAVLTDRAGFQLLGAGHNRFPEGVPSAPENYADRTFKYAHIRHAEIWALLRAEKTVGKHLLLGSTIYTSFMCCPACARAALKAGVARFVSPPLDTAGRSPEWIAQWSASQAETLALLDEAGVTVSVRHV